MIKDQLGNIPVFNSAHEESKDERTETQSEHKERGQKQNAVFEMYYKELKIIPEEEWSIFYEKLKEPLDISFRINSIE